MSKFNYVCGFINMHAKDLLLSLLKIPSYSKEEKEMMDFIADSIAKMGYEAKIEDEMNLVIDAGHEMYIATHMDTIRREMPVRIEENRIYGRGASDAKASIAAILLFLERARELNVSVAFLSDEEEDAKGSQAFVKKHRPKNAIIMEPTSLRICNYQAGSIEAIFEIESDEIHGSFCGGAIDRAMEMLDKLKAMECWKKGKYFDSCLTVQEIKSINPYYLCPAKCEGRIEARLLAEQKADEVAGEMKTIIERYGKVDFKEIWNGFEIGENEKLLQIAKRACFDASISFSLDGMPSWTDAIIFNNAAIKCIIFGPGELKYAHTMKEFVRVEEIEKAAEFLLALNKAIAN